MFEMLLMILLSCLFVLAGIIYINLDREDDYVELQKEELRKEGETK